MYFKTKAIVLKVSPASQKNTYVTLYTENFGKLTCLAKGLGKNEARLKSVLLPFVLSETIFVFSGGQPLITRAELIKSLFPKKIKAQVFAFYLADLLDQATDEGLRDRKIFRLIQGVLNYLSYSRTKEVELFLVLAYFALRFSQYLGYGPALDVCDACKRRFGLSNKAFFIPATGEFVCKACFDPHKKNYLEIAAKERSLLKSFLKKRFDQLPKNILKLAEAKEIARLANLCLFSLIDVKPKSYSSLKNLLS